MPSRMGFSGHLSFTLPFLPRATRLACLQERITGANPNPRNPFSLFHTSPPVPPAQGGSGKARPLAGPANRALAQL